MLKVELVPPKDGWAVLLVSRGTEVVEFSFSYSPRDSVEDLIEAVDRIVTSPGESSVVLRAGPEELDIEFARHEDRVDVRLVTYPNSTRHRDVPGDERMSFSGNPRLIGKVFWRALRDLQSRIPAPTYLQEWHHPFPERLVAQLGSRFEE